LADRLVIPKSRAYTLARGDHEPLPAQPSVVFHIRGHSELRASHHKTLEFKRDGVLSPKETCVVGLCADWDPAEIKRLSGPIRITIGDQHGRDSLVARICPRYDARDRMVFRKSAKQNAVTAAIYADKGAADLDRALCERLMQPETRLTVTLEAVAPDEVVLC
jgi:hypothetical protein